MDRAPSALSPQARVRALEALSGPGAEELDVLVVGGGVVGAGVALDAVTRGLSTGLLEQRDLASGTSSRSSKLIHGGLRYLEMLDFSLVREALRERVGDGDDREDADGPGEEPHIGLDRFRQAVRVPRTRDRPDAPLRRRSCRARRGRPRRGASARVPARDARPS